MKSPGVSCFLLARIHHVEYLLLKTQILRSCAVIMSLIQSAKLNGHDPYRYLKDVLERLPTQSASRIDELLPHRWQPEPLTH
jgi:IS66 C-terminal element